MPMFMVQLVLQTQPKCPSKDKQIIKCVIGNTGNKYYKGNLICCMETGVDLEDMAQNQ